MKVEEYTEQLEEIMIKRDDGLRIMPELYSVPPDKVDAEYHNPKSQDRVMMGKIPQMWGQSLYVLGKLVKEVSGPVTNPYLSRLHLPMSNIISCSPLRYLSANIYSCPWFIPSYIICQGFLSPGELDPLNRRLTAEPKPDIVVQGKSLHIQIVWYSDISS